MFSFSFFDAFLQESFNLISAHSIVLAQRFFGDPLSSDYGRATLLKNDTESMMIYDLL